MGTVARALRLVAILSCTMVAFSDASRAQFNGEVVAKWLDDGRRMELMEAFGFTDPNGQHWEVPKGAIVDGASIPQILWSIVGSPYTGQYRKASVIHDHYCDIMARPWRAVHQAFFDASIAEGNSSSIAKLMYAAVFRWGPRWEYVDGKPSKMRHVMSEPTVNDIKELDAWISRRNPTLREIEKRFGGSGNSK